MILYIHLFWRAVPADTATPHRHNQKKRNAARAQKWLAQLRLFQLAAIDQTERLWQVSLVRCLSAALLHCLVGQPSFVLCLRASFHCQPCCLLCLSLSQLNPSCCYAFRLLLVGVCFCPSWHPSSCLLLAFLFSAVLAVFCSTKAYVSLYICKQMKLALVFATPPSAGCHLPFALCHLPSALCALRSAALSPVCKVIAHFKLLKPVQVL